MVYVGKVKRYYIVMTRFCKLESENARAPPEIRNLRLNPQVVCCAAAVGGKCYIIVSGLLAQKLDKEKK